jgi:hypothetical protein
MESLQNTQVQNVELQNKNNKVIINQSSLQSSTYSSADTSSNTNFDAAADLKTFVSNNFNSSNNLFVSSSNSDTSSHVNSSVHTNSLTQSSAATSNAEAASVHLCADKWLDAIQQMRSSSLSFPESDLDEIEFHVRYGITLSLSDLPESIHFSNTTTVDDNHSLVADRIAEYISIGAIQVLNPESTSSIPFVQPLHVVIKDGKKPRLVIDLSRNLNDLLSNDSFNYTSIRDAVRISSDQCYYSKLDISNCFLSFPLHPSMYKYFVFQFNSVYYQFVRLPFGLSTAPRICTLMLSVIEFVLTQQYQLSSVRYLDDFLFVSHSFHIASEHLSIAVSVFERFGLVVNKKKTEGPSQSIQFLGINLNSVSRTLSISSQRVDETNSLLFHYIDTPASAAIRVHDIMSFVGKLSFVSQVLPSARPFMRRLLDSIKGKRKRQRCRIPVQFKLDCAVWLQRLHHWNGLISWSIHTQEPFVIISDASIKGFGFYLAHCPRTVDFNQLPVALLPGSAVSGAWHPSMSSVCTSSSIAYLELFSVLYALTMLGSVLQQHSVHILTDNASNVPIINKQRTKSAKIIGLLRAMAELSAKHVFACSAKHIAGESNVLADFLSRPELHLNDHINIWNSSKFCHSFPLSHVFVVCSSSLMLPNPTPPLNLHSHNALNANLNYLPSLTSSSQCHFDPVQNELMLRINEHIFDSVNLSL